MFGMGAKLFQDPEQLEDAIRLTEGCVWSYFNTPSGIMPENFEMNYCRDKDDCKWDEVQWLANIVYPSDDAVKAARKRGIHIVNPYSSSSETAKAEEDLGEGPSPMRASMEFGEQKVIEEELNESARDEFDIWLQRARNVLETSGTPKGFKSITDARYLLRPEAVESVFYMV
jgi:hypothetical protein